MTTLAVGDRIEAIAGDDKGERGYVTAIVESESTSVHWTMDDGARIKSAPERVRLVARFVPRCDHADCADHLDLARACWLASRE